MRRNFLFRLKIMYGALNYSKDDSTNTVEIFPNQIEVAVIYNKEKPEDAYLQQDPSAKKTFSIINIIFCSG